MNSDKKINIKVIVLRDDKVYEEDKKQLDATTLKILKNAKKTVAQKNLHDSE